MTGDVERLAAWLAPHRVTHVAMEATGVSWKPVWTVLAADFELLLANAAHVKNVPGRKTDVNDAPWRAELLAQGLIRASFVPRLQIQALRDLTRTRTQLVREQSWHVQRIDKLLQAANVKLGSVLSDITGRSGRAILNALAAGARDPEQLARCVQTRIRAARTQLVEALRGRLAEHQRMLRQIHLSQSNALGQAIAHIDQQIGEGLDPFGDAVQRLSTIPGVSQVSAAVIVSEIGVDMSRFATPAHLISWAGLCPKSDESAGKRRSTRLRKGAPWLKTLLVQVACSATRGKSGYLPALFRRLCARRGPRKAVVAVAAAILTAVYWLLHRGSTDQDRGPRPRPKTAAQDRGADHFQQKDRQRIAARLTQQLSQLGFDVSLAERQPVAVSP